MNDRLIRIVSATAVIVPCAVFIVLRAVWPELPIPWGSLVLYFIAVGAFTLLRSTGQDRTARDANEGNAHEMYLEARRKLIDWLKVQGVVLTVFVGVSGFFIIQQSVRQVAEKEFNTAHDTVNELTERAVAARVALEQATEHVKRATTAAHSAAQQAAAAAGDATQAAEAVQARIRRLQASMEARFGRLDGRADRLERRFEEAEDVIERRTDQASRMASKALVADKDPKELLGLSGEDEERVLAALQELGRKGPKAGESVPKIASVLTDATRTAELRREAAQTLGLIASQPEIAVPALTTALEDPSNEVRQAAIDALSYFCDDAEPAVDKLVELLEDEDIETAARVATTLRWIDRHHDRVVPAIVQTMKSVPPERSEAFATALRTFGGRAEQATEFLREYVRGNLSEYPEPALYAYAAFCSVNPNEAVSLLDEVSDFVGGRERPEDPGAPLLEDFAFALRRLGKKGEPAIPFLVNRMQLLTPDSHPAFSLTYVGTCGTLDDLNAISWLRDEMTEQALSTQLAAIIEVIHGYQTGGVSALIKSLDSPKDLVHYQALWIVFDLGPRAHEAVPRLTQLLNELRGDARSVRQSLFARDQASMAMQALVRIGVASDEVLDALQELSAEGRYPELRRQARFSLARLQGP